MLLLKICKYEEVCFKVLTINLWDHFLISTAIRGLEKGHNDGEYTYDISTQSYKAITFLTEGKRQVRPKGGRLLVVLIKNFIYLSVCQSVITSQ